MLAIKLKPIGKKKQISYRIAVMEKKSKLKGKFIDDLGWYNPHTDKFSIDLEKVGKWLSSGAQPTDSVHNILVTAKALKEPKIPLHKKSKQEPKPAEEVKSEAPTPPAETQEAVSPETAPTETPKEEPAVEENPAQ